MGKAKLEPRAALNGYTLQRDGLSLSEITGCQIISLACNAEQRSTVSDTLTSTLGVEWPQVGNCAVSEDTTVRILGLQQDQVFVVLDNSTRLDAVLTAVEGIAFWTEQSDSWVGIRVSGKRRFDVLERTCAVDLAPEVFADECVVRTSMEHMGSIIYRDKQSFVVMATRSMAGSFVRMLEQSVRFTL